METNISKSTLIGVGAIATATIGMLLYYKFRSQSEPSQVERIRRLYNLNVPFEEEKSYKIQRIEIFPCRGVKGWEVESVKVYSTGIKYDREWAFIDKVKKSHYAMTIDCRMSLLNQRIEKDPATKKKYLVISVDPGHDDIVSQLPTPELRVEMVKEHSGELISNERYSGYLEPPHTEAWISAFVGKPIQMLRSPQKAVTLNKKLMIHSQEDDLKKAMCSKSAIHCINETSMNYLKKRVLDKYPEEEHSKFKIDSKTMRPNFTFETENEFDEDAFAEVRIGSVLMRVVGYCARCMAVPINYDTNELNPEEEPNTTLKEFRKHPQLGLLFGTYYQVDIIPSETEYQKLLPGYPKLDPSRFNQNYGIVKKGDEFRVRVKDLKVQI